MSQYIKNWERMKKENIENWLLFLKVRKNKDKLIILTKSREIDKANFI